MVAKVASGSRRLAVVVLRFLNDSQVDDTRDDIGGGMLARFWTEFWAHHARWTFLTRLGVWLGIVGVMLGIAGGLIGLGSWLFPRIPPPENEGILVPGSLATPPDKCDEKGDKVRVLLGGNVLLFRRQSGPLVAIRGGGKDLLTLDRTEKGIQVSAHIFSEDGRVVAEMKGTQWYVNPNNIYRKVLDGRSHLTVMSQQGLVAFEVEYLNPRAIRISGIFMIPGRGPMPIAKDKTSFPGEPNKHVEGNCMEDVRYIFDL